MADQPRFFFFDQPPPLFVRVFGLGFAVLGGFGIYAGIKGFIALVHGSHAAPADPLACTIGVLGGAWAGTIGLRFLIAPDTARPVLSQPLLFLASLGALAGTAWFWTFTDAPDFRLKLTLEFGGAGILGLVLWWSRRKGRSRLG